MSPAAESAVLFDLDGTLIDSPAGIKDVLRRALAEELGVEDVDDRALRSTIGQPLSASVSLLSGLPEDHPDVAKGVARTRSLFTSEVVPQAKALVFDGITDLLTSLARRGVGTAVVTSKISLSARELLTGADLLERFDVVVGNDQTCSGKPHPDPALLAARLLDVPPHRCVVVGDSVDDVVMAKRAGMAVLGVSYGVSSVQELHHVGADTVVGGVGVLTEVILDWLDHTSSVATLSGMDLPS